MTQKFKNNTFGLLANTITGAATNITLATGHGARFPALAAGEYFKATLVQINISTLAETAWEIVKITARSGDVLTVERAQEGTLALAWGANTRIEMRVTAETLVMLSNAGASAAISAQASAAAADASATTATTQAGNAANSATAAANSAAQVASFVSEASVGMGSGTAINLNSGRLFYKTISVNTTLSVTNVPAGPTAVGFTLELTNGGSKTITWWSGIKWDSGSAPTLTASGTDILGFYTRDGGTTWRGAFQMKDSK